MNDAWNFLDEVDIKKIEKIRIKYAEFKLQLEPIERCMHECKCESEYVYGTTALEGSSLSLRETQILLTDGTISGENFLDENSLREIKEVRNYSRVKAYRGLCTGEKLNLKITGILHSLIVADIDETTPEDFQRNDPVCNPEFKSRSTSSPLINEKLEGAINEFYFNIKNDRNPFEQAILFLYRLETTRPFKNGNGKAGRELLNYLLQEAGYPRLIIRKQEQEAYFLALYYGNQGKHTEMMRVFVDIYAGYYAGMLRKPSF